MSKAEALAQMHASFAEVDEVLQRIPRDRFTDAGVTDEWSVKDLLAHIAGYERWVAAATYGDLEGRVASNEEYFGRDEAPTDADGATDDTTNAWVVAHARQLSLHEVLDEYRWAHNRLVAAVEACREEQLSEPGRLPFTKERSLLEVLPGQCWGHHREHASQLQAFAETVIGSADG